MLNRFKNPKYLIVRFKGLASKRNIFIFHVLKFFGLTVTNIIILWVSKKTSAWGYKRGPHGILLNRNFFLSNFSSDYRKAKFISEKYVLHTHDKLLRLIVFNSINKKAILLLLWKFKYFYTSIKFFINNFFSHFKVLYYNQYCSN
jgi:hypothetical protein